MRKQTIKVGFCVAYDWELLRTSIPRIYAASETICLAVDKDRHSWSCNPFEFDEEAFRKFVSEVDKEGKIVIYEDDFSLQELNARENCNRHRMLIAEKMGKGGWHIQLDCDEYFLDFPGFVQQLLKMDRYPSGDEKIYNVCVNFIPIFKKLETGYLVVNFGNNLPEKTPIATNRPDYTYARRNDHFDRVTRHYLLHETWARTESELRFKINNWGHSAEELKTPEQREEYILLWKKANRENFSELRNVHPTHPPAWPGLEFIEAGDIEALIEKFIPEPEYPLSPFQVYLRNNRNVARIKHWLGA